jgi:hypothetical protein
MMNPITIRTRLESDIIKLGKRVKSLVGKQVEIIIRELATPQPKEKHWRHLGASDLHGKLDNVNIRELAHDE